MYRQKNYKQLTAVKKQDIANGTQAHNPLHILLLVTNNTGH